MNREELRAAAAAASVAELCSRLRAAASAFEEHLRAHPSPGAESVDNWATARMTIGLAQEILYVALTGELPDGEADQAEADPKTLAVQYSVAIESCIAHVDEADPGAFLDVTWAHPQLGPLNWREWICFLAMDAERRTKAAEEPSAASDVALECGN